MRFGKFLTKIKVYIINIYFYIKIKNKQQNTK